MSRSMRFLGLLLLANIASAHFSTQEKAARQESLDAKWGLDWGFSGISTFAHLPHVRCLQEQDEEFDIAIIGAPFDTSVSYRTGARFGPRAIRAASARQTPARGYNARANINPYLSWAKIMDCGDIPISPYDNELALRQMTEGFVELSTRSAVAKGLSGTRKPRFISLGGDHSIALPELRALSKSYGQPITVLHFDAHLDTWDPTAYPSAWFDPDKPTEEQQSAFTHGTMFWLAGREGLIANGSVHAGLRTRLTGIEDNESDSLQGWTRIQSDDIALDRLGPAGVAKKIMDTIGTEKPVLLSIDIDIIDPGLAPGTGTPEPGGWMTRELIQVLRGIEDLNVVGADVVEVSPGYDGSGEQTALAAAQVVYEILTSIVKRGLKDLDVDAVKDAAGATRDEL